MKPILTLILLTTFCFTLTSESSAQPAWKEQMKRQQEFERENAKRFREINRERAKSQAEFERESFKNYAEQQREAAKWQAEQQREQQKGWEEQQRFYAEQQRENFQNQREFQRDRGQFRGGFPQGQGLGGNRFGQPIPGVYQSVPSAAQRQGFPQPTFGRQRSTVPGGRGQVFQNGFGARGQIPAQGAGEIIIHPPSNQPFQQEPVINEGPYLDAPGEAILGDNFGNSVLQPGTTLSEHPHFSAVPPINYGPIQ